MAISCLSLINGPDTLSTRREPDSVDCHMPYEGRRNLFGFIEYSGLCLPLSEASLAHFANSVAVKYVCYLHPLSFPFPTKQP